MVRRAKKPAAPKEAIHKYSWLSMVAYTVNYTVGTGMLALPNTLGQSSVFLTLVLLVISILSATFMATCGNDAIARAMALQRVHETFSETRAKRRARRRAASTAGASDRLHSAVEMSASVLATESQTSNLSNMSTLSRMSLEANAHGHGGARRSGSMSHCSDNAAPEHPHHVINEVIQLVPDYTVPYDTPIIFSDMMRVFFGLAGFYIYQVMSIIFQLTTVWSYFNVVASSLASVIPFPGLPEFRSSGQKIWVCAGPCTPAPPYYPYCNQAYWIWLCITFIYTQIMVFFNLSEQKVLQTIFTYARFLVIVLCIIVAAIALGVGPFQTLPSRMAPPYQWAGTMLLFYNSYDIGNMFSLLMFSVVFHNAIPEIMQPVKEGDRPLMNRAFYVTFTIIFLITGMVIFICGVFFGANSNSLVTLNFTTWDGVGWDYIGERAPWWAKVISYVTRLLPPFYLITAIPINAIIERDNFVAFWPRRFQSNVGVIASMNIVAVVTGFFLAGYVRCLNVILNYAGLVAYVILLCPGFMSYFGRQKCIRVFGREHGTLSPYSGWANHPVVVWYVFVLMVISFPLTVYGIAAAGP